jgi:hypothetical protein
MKFVRRCLHALTLVLLAPQVVLAASVCDPSFTRKIPALADTQCSAHLYALFPKLREYKGQLWEAGPSCVLNGAASPSNLSLQYCRPGSGNSPGANQDFSVDIWDLHGPQYQTKINQSLLKITLMIFDSAIMGPSMQVYPSSNKLIDKDMARVSMPSGASTTYGFTALWNKRYFIQMRINGKDRFKMPEDVDAFVLEYTQAMMFDAK